MWKSEDNPRPEPWYNLKEQFYFDTKREAMAKMDELDQLGVVGWPIQLAWYRAGKYDGQN